MTGSSSSVTATEVEEAAAAAIGGLEQTHILRSPKLLATQICECSWVQECLFRNRRWWIPYLQKLNRSRLFTSEVIMIMKEQCALGQSWFLSMQMSVTCKGGNAKAGTFLQQTYPFRIRVTYPWHMGHIHSEFWIIYLIKIFIRCLSASVEDFKVSWNNIMKTIQNSPVSILKPSV